MRDGQILSKHTENMLNALTSLFRQFVSYFSSKLDFYINRLVKVSKDCIAKYYRRYIYIIQKKYWSFLHIQDKEKLSDIFTLNRGITFVKHVRDIDGNSKM